ncbi:MAG TPA: DUF1549 and DUF1553 domain-containing protein [Gemmataceae bacterium]|nr:DUF1549 and DUF1553 domain-containing protein [Gemmataceae bacterium]
MLARLPWLAVLSAFLFAGGSALAEQKPDPSKPPGDVEKLAASIDHNIAHRWGEAKIEPAPSADDAEYLRRVYLDLAGRIPSVEEARTFLADRRPDKRARLVEQILGGSRYVAHFTNVWRMLLLPEAGNNFQVRLQQPSFEAWLKQMVAKNAGYDEMARELLTAPFNKGISEIELFLGAAAPTPLAFYAAKEFKPENLAASTARVFLGVNVECAQCHNHPFAEWKREEFWGFAAFFAGIKSRRTMDLLLPEKEVQDKRELIIPGTERVAQARFLDGTEPVWKSKSTSRGALVEWMTAPNNPYFARAAVNRLWAYFFGTGLVDPVDQMAGGDHQPSHPELLDLLAREFAVHRFDVKCLIRAITASRAYQLTSAAYKDQDGRGHEDRTLFARMPLRGLTAEQLFDSVAMATGYRDSGRGDDLFSGFLGGQRSARSAFLTRFANQPERATEAQTSILQALSLMNGKVVAAATSLENSETLAAVVEAPFVTTEERIETLYLATLSRKPEAKEQRRTVRFINNALQRGKDSQHVANDALADVFWALLNSPEFIVNH